MGWGRVCDVAGSLRRLTPSALPDRRTRRGAQLLPAGNPPHTRVPAHLLTATRTPHTADAVGVVGLLDRRPSPRPAPPRHAPRSAVSAPPDARQVLTPSRSRPSRCRAPTCHETGATAPRGSPATLVAGRVARVHPPGNSHGWASRAEATRHPVGLHTAGRYGGGVYATATPTEGVPNNHSIRSRAEDVGTPSRLTRATGGARHRITTTPSLGWVGYFRNPQELFELS